MMPLSRFRKLFRLSRYRRSASERIVFIGSDQWNVWGRQNQNPKRTLDLHGVDLSLDYALALLPHGVSPG